MQASFKDKVAINPDTLFILVADECHWGSLYGNVRDSCTQHSLHNIELNML